MYTVDRVLPEEPSPTGEVEEDQGHEIGEEDDGEDIVVSPGLEAVV